MGAKKEGMDIFEEGLSFLVDVLRWRCLICHAAVNVVVPPHEVTNGLELHIEGLAAKRLTEQRRAQAP